MPINSGQPVEARQHNIENEPDDLLETMEYIARSVMAEQRGPFIARVVDFEQGKARVQRVVRALHNGRWHWVPQLTCVPNTMWAAGGKSASWHLKRGDLVVCIVLDHSMDLLLAAGNDVDDIVPETARRKDISDAVIIGGFRPFGARLQNYEADTLLIGDDHYADPESTEPLKRLRVSPDVVELAVEEDGEVKVGVCVDKDRKVAIGEQSGADPAELLAMFGELLDFLIDPASLVTVPNQGTPTPELTALASSIKSKLDRIKK